MSIESMKVRLTQHETNDLVFRLEERRYGHRFNSMELAQKANVPLDEVNRVERQLPIEDPGMVGRIAKILGIGPDLLGKIAGWQEITEGELHLLDRCLAMPGEAMPTECEQIGLRRQP